MTIAVINKETNKSKQTKVALQNTQGALHSALLSTRNAGGFSALHLAAQNGHNQSCREILLAGANPDVQNNVSSAAIEKCTILKIYICFYHMPYAYKCNIIIKSSSYISICSMATLHCIQRVDMDMRAQHVSYYRPNAIHCESI